MPEQIFAELADNLELVPLEMGVILSDPDRPAKAVYFIESGLLTRSVAAEGSKEVCVGVLGRSGFVGVSIVLDAEIPLHRVRVLVPGAAMRIDAEKLVIAMAKEGLLRQHLLRYVRVLLDEISQSALFNTVHKIDVRLARFLIRCSEELGSSQLPFTHEFLSESLGVRRASVTEGLLYLERRGGIVRARGCVDISNFSTLRLLSGP